MSRRGGRRVTRLAGLAAALVVAGIVAAGCGGGGGGGGNRTVTVDDGSIEIEAHDVYFDVDTIRTPPGDLDVLLTQHGNQAHTFVIEGVEGFKLTVTSSARSERGTVTLEPGTYEFFCDIPGHRSQGMKGTVVVE